MVCFVSSRVHGQAPPDNAFEESANAPLRADNDDNDDNGGEPQTEQQEMGRLLADDIPDSSAALSTDADRWVLQQILRHEFAQTPMREAGVGTLALPRISQYEQDWPLVLEREQQLARLRGEPEQHHGVNLAQVTFDIPLASHPLVDLYIDYFTGRGRWFFQRWLSRANRYVPVMQQVLAAKGVPKDLVYLAMIESGFSAKAYSTASAAGYWQFIGSTGKLYGLATDTWIDERRDFVRATEAAATYLAQLYKQLGDWHLAWASYNAGEGRVRRALAKYATHDFWSLIEYPKSLTKETRHYVPKIIAAAIVAKDAQRYGFTNVAAEPLVFDEVEVRRAVDLRRLAARARVSLQTLRDLNPALLHDVTPPNRAILLRVPPGDGQPVAELLATMSARERLGYQRHIVRSGDTLYGISRRYRSQVSAIKDFNQLSSSRLALGQELIVPTLPTSAQASSSTRALVKIATPKAAKRSAHRQPRARHIVASGETLWSIARQYHVTVDRIRGRPGRKPSRLAVGEVLEIF